MDFFPPKTNAGTRTQQKEHNSESIKHERIKGFMLFFSGDEYHQPNFICEKRKQIVLRYATKSPKQFITKTG